MGNRLVDAAFRFAAERQLDHQPTRLLVWLASVVSDDDTGRTYCAGRDGMAFALGLDSTSKRTVRRAVVTLVEAGAVERVYRGHRSTNSAYRLTIERS